jgi:alkylresorcinol/alkylpyrone synthase
VRLLSLACAVPEHVIDQQVAAEHARTFFSARMRNYERLAGAFASPGIERRYSVCPVDWFAQPHGWPERTQTYIESACALYENAVRAALAQAGLQPHDIDTVVTISSTGIATPSLEARVLPRMGFPPHTQRVPVFGLGCAGGVSGLALASRLASAQPGSRVLMVAVELCTLAFRLDRATKVNVIATSLFADGAVATILSTDAARPALAMIGNAAEHQWPNTLNIMGWATDDLGFGVVLSRSLPDFVAKNYRAVFEAARARMGLADTPIDRVICHPGGMKVIDALENMLGMKSGGLDHERGVMRDFGNMSSPTVFFVLERLIAQGLPAHTLLAALGPGFTASFIALQAA